jgi:Domain of unknown function (DUF4160)
MVTVLRASGLNVVIFLDDHEPAHVHVFGDGEAKIELVGQDETPRLVWARGMTRAEVRRAMRIVTQHRDALLRRWREIHG